MSTQTPALWRPTASLQTLRARAALNRSVRAFFDARAVMEVETPVLSAHATVDRQIESFASVDGRWLHTSPEFAMKRLLAAGSGPIYQIAHVFRREEAGRWHNPEFSLLEWYRPGWDHRQLMDEVEALLRRLGVGADARYQRISYRQAFEHEAGFDPWVSTAALMRERAVAEGLLQAGEFEAEADPTFWLDLWMSLRVGPRLGRGAPCFVYDFPEAQAALSRVRPGDPPVAERFELFWQGLELANGFHELGDAQEQQRRFVAEQRARQAAAQPVPPYDTHLIDALAAGLPDCAGVAVGLDRVLMLMLGLSSLEQTLAFAAARA